MITVLYSFTLIYANAHDRACSKFNFDFDFYFLLAI